MGKNGKVLLFMGESKTSPWDSGKKLAIVDLYSKSFHWVTGLPEIKTINQVTWGINSLLDSKNNIIHVGINTSNGNFIYQVDLTTAKATKGLQVNGGVISSIKYLPKN